MTYYLAAYFDGRRWRLINRELSTDKRQCEALMTRYAESGYKVVLKTVSFDAPLVKHETSQGT